MDLKEQQISDSSSPSSQTKSCSDCHTTKTPLWRGGPSGPKSLCNACGIKYNKKRRALLGLNSGNKYKKKIGGLKQQKNSSSGSISCGEVGRSLKLKLVTMGGRGDMVLQQRSPSSSSSAAAAAAANQQQKEQQMRSKKFGEEEQAAILLMALSCGSFY